MDDLQHEVERLRGIIECGCNALTDSIKVSGNDADTNMHWVRKMLRDMDAREVPKATVDYILRYGSRCRDCADENGICPSSGLPCGGAEKAVRHVLAAYLYGVEKGYIETN